VDEGYQLFDFGRTSPLNKSLMDFKSRWGTEVRDLPEFVFPKGAKSLRDRNTSKTHQLLRQAFKITPESI